MPTTPVSSPALEIAEPAVRELLKRGLIFEDAGPEAIAAMEAACAAPLDELLNDAMLFTAIERMGPVAISKKLNGSSRPTVVLHSMNQNATAAVSALGQGGSLREAIYYALRKTGPVPTGMRAPSFMPQPELVGACSSRLGSQNLGPLLPNTSYKPLHDTLRAHAAPVQCRVGRGSALLSHLEQMAPVAIWSGKDGKGAPSFALATLDQQGLYPMHEYGSAASLDACITAASPQAAQRELDRIAAGLCSPDEEGAILHGRRALPSLNQPATDAELLRGSTRLAQSGHAGDPVSFPGLAFSDGGARTLTKVGFAPSTAPTLAHAALRTLSRRRRPGRHARANLRGLRQPQARTVSRSRIGRGFNPRTLLRDAQRWLFPKWKQPLFPGCPPYRRPPPAPIQFEAGPAQPGSESEPARPGHPPRPVPSRSGPPDVTSPHVPRRCRHVPTQPTSQATYVRNDIRRW